MASNPQHEPTMEEILASIRKIISEDSTEAPAAAAPAAPAAHEADVLELTQELPEEPPPPPAAPKPEPVRAAAPTPPKPDDVVFETVEEPPAPAAAPAASDDIFSEKTRKALDDSFSRIPQAVAPVPTPAPAPARSVSVPDGSSVEAVFERAVSNAFDPVLHQWMDANKADLMAAVKPLIREWMDEHFPALLEGAVRNEVERVVKARGGK
jgi:cell pole-organizing protein PopZ